MDGKQDLSLVSFYQISTSELSINHSISSGISSPEKVLSPSTSKPVLVSFEANCWFVRQVNARLSGSLGGQFFPFYGLWHNFKPVMFPSSRCVCMAFRRLRYIGKLLARISASLCKRELVEENRKTLFSLLAPRGTMRKSKSADRNALVEKTSWPMLRRKNRKMEKSKR